MSIVPEQYSALVNPSNTAGRGILVKQSIFRMLRFWRLGQALCRLQYSDTFQMFNAAASRLDTICLIPVEVCEYRPGAIFRSRESFKYRWEGDPGQTKHISPAGPGQA